MPTRDDPGPFEAEMAASLGRYENHRFCLRLAPEVSLIDDDGTPKATLETDVLVVLLHEYIHFLHNLSTSSGFVAYQCFQQLLAVFSNALNEDGTCDPAALSEEQRQVARGAIDKIDVLEGARALPSHASAIIGLSVVRTQRSTVHVGGVPVQRADVEWDVVRRDGTRERYVAPVGAFLIEEGIAFTLEECVRFGRVTFERSGVAPPPIYPYEAFRILVQYYASEISALSALRLGILALCTNRPGATLLHALDAYKRLRASGVDETAACRTIRDDCEGITTDITQRICSFDLDELSRMHLGRGIVADGHAAVLDEFRRLLSRRAVDPWFDLAWCHDDGTIDLQELNALLLNTVPCDAIQERWGNEEDAGRDLLLTFKAGGIERHDGSVAPTAGDSGLRAVQAQFEFLLAHLSPSQGIVATRSPSPRRCPFFTTCGLEMRRNEPMTCRDTPWARLTKEGATCWYGVAVRATLGTIGKE